ncbi:hypothetical protein ABTE35_19065, partial [Acinetobacter baumannii]
SLKKWIVEVDLIPKLHPFPDLILVCQRVEPAAGKKDVEDVDTILIQPPPAATLGHKPDAAARIDGTLGFPPLIRTA